MILRRSPDSRTLVTYDGYVDPRLGVPTPWRVLWHEGPANWSPGTHLDEATVTGWPDLADRDFERDAVAKGIALEMVANTEIRRLKGELRRMGKAYGKASATIGTLRNELALARLYRVCWKSCQESGCASCRTVFGEPADTPVIGKGQFEDPGDLEGLPRERSRSRPKSLGMGKNGPADLSEREFCDEASYYARGED